MRILSLAAAGGLAMVAAVAPVSAESGTTRIETRPFYGAVVTIEEGVRVFRPLPPTKRVIINPGGVTPLSLGFNETTVNERRYNYNYNYGSDEPERGNSGVGGFYGYGPSYGYGRGHGGHRGGHGGPRGGPGGPGGRGH